MKFNDFEFILFFSRNVLLADSPHSTASTIHTKYLKWEKLYVYKLIVNIYDGLSTGEWAFLISPFRECKNR